jgi:agmatine deiminase
MSWPDAAMGSPPSDLLCAQREIATIANIIAKYEPVWLYASPSNVDTASQYVSGNVTVKPLEVEDIWMRDIGPVFVKAEDGQRQVGIDFNFQHWGRKLSTPRNADRYVAQKLLDGESIERVSASIVAEGGGLETDGEGTLIATESSIINPNRNPDKSKDDIEAALRDLLGVTKIIWLPGITDTEITDCHIDALARFADPRTVILSRPNNAISHDDPNYTVYDQAHHILSSATNANGESFKIIEIEEALTVPRKENTPQDQTVVQQEDDWVPATSYVNFYLANGAVIMPQFGDERTDSAAVETMRLLFPDRVVETVKLDWMAYAGGGKNGL